MIYIYLITNKRNGKQYVGQSVRPKERFKQHYDHGLQNRGGIIGKAMIKYGLESFTMKVIDQSKTNFRANYLEGHYIGLFKTLAPNGYNIQEDGRTPNRIEPIAITRLDRIKQEQIDEQITEQGLERYWQLRAKQNRQRRRNKETEHIDNGSFYDLILPNGKTVSLQNLKLIAEAFNTTYQDLQSGTGCKIGLFLVSKYSEKTFCKVCNRLKFADQNDTCTYCKYPRRKKLNSRCLDPLRQRLLLSIN